MWVLAATTGMRRAELLGVRRDKLDLDAGTLTIDETLISAAGRAEESDGKTEAGVGTVSLGSFTIAALQRHLDMLDAERQVFGPAYAAGGWLFVWENGQRPHPDTVTDRFNGLIDKTGARRIRLHDVRHTYSTLSRMSGIASDASFDGSCDCGVTRTCGVGLVLPGSWQSRRHAC
jgi:integrase